MTPGAFLTRARHSMLAVLVVCTAAVLPYLLTVRDYFVADDFGVIQILSQKPLWYFPRWFIGSWMETVFGVPPQEIRPFPAVSYQLTALAGTSAPTVHHVVNTLIHMANGILVLTIARRCARMTLPAAMLTALLFVVLPVHVESVAWITGRVDSLPALFYLASFLVYARWRSTGSNNVWRYLMSVFLFFAALFSKENTITMVASLMLYDVLVAKPTDASWKDVRTYVPYVPFVLLTVIFLLLRYALFGDLVRESELTSGALASFGDRLGRHLQRIVLGSVTRGAPVVWVSFFAAIGFALVAWWMRIKGDARTAIGVVLYFGPVWTLIAFVPTIAAGYESPRHLYLAAVGWAMSLGFAFQAALVRTQGSRWRIVTNLIAAAVVAGYLVPLRAALEDLHGAATISKVAATDLHREASTAAPGTLLIVGAPLRSWEWAMPLVARPPFASEDLTRRVFMVSPWLLHCCRTEWLADTHRSLREWSAQPTRKPIVILQWDSETGRASRLTDAEYPDLRTVIPVLIEEQTTEYLDSLIVRVTDLARTSDGVRR